MTEQSPDGNNERKEATARAGKSIPRSVVDALSISVGGAPNSPIVLVIALVLMSAAFWGIRSVWDRRHSDSNIVLFFPDLVDRAVTVELNGREAASSNNGFFRFDGLLLGTHSLALVIDDRLAARRQFQINSGGKYEYGLDFFVEGAIFESPPPQDRATVGQESVGSDRRIYDVVIDPGHGGKDPGATGRVNNAVILEKDINLSIALALKKELTDRGISAGLTRSDDFFMMLSARREFAEKSCRELFISLHADAYRGESPRGAAAYILSDEGTSAAIERSTGNGNDAAIVRTESNFYRQSAQRIGQSILNGLAGAGYVGDSEPRYAHLTTLGQFKCPSILVELGSVTNTEDASRLVLDPRRPTVAIAEAIAADVAFRHLQSD